VGKRKRPQVRSLTAIKSTPSAKRRSSEPENPLGVSIKQLALDLFARRQPPQGSDGLGALAAEARARHIIAIAAVNQLVLVALDKIARMVLVALQQANRGTSRFKLLLDAEPVQ